MTRPEESRSANTRRRRVWYIAVPLLSALAMVAMYFSGVPLLRQIITPTMEGMYGNSQRELGLLENLQNVLLITTVAIAIRGAVRKERLYERLAFAGLACLALLVFLEEIDYGLHFHEYVRGIQADEATTKRNWHNVGERTSTIKRAVDLGMFLLFAVLPFAARKSSNRHLRYVAPDRYSIVTLIGSVLISKTAHLLNDQGFGDAANIGSNISEFREYVTYWLFLLYVHELVYRREPEAPPAEQLEESAREG